jgi:hypothetical protein
MSTSDYLLKAREEHLRELRRWLPVDSVCETIAEYVNVGIVFVVLSNRNEYFTPLHERLPVEGIDEMILEFLKFDLYVQEGSVFVSFRGEIGFPRIQFPPGIMVYSAVNIQCAPNAPISLWWNHDTMQRWGRPYSWVNGVDKYESNVETTKEPMEICFDGSVTEMALKVRSL